LAVLLWRPDTPANPASATITVHNDGNASAGACIAYWVTANGKSRAALTLCRRSIQPDPAAV
jgi:hypothetical protein